MKVQKIPEVAEAWANVAGFNVDRQQYVAMKKVLQQYVPDATAPAVVDPHKSAILVVVDGGVFELAVSEPAEQELGCIHLRWVPTRPDGSPVSVTVRALNVAGMSMLTSDWTFRFGDETVKISARRVLGDVSPESDEAPAWVLASRAGWHRPPAEGEELQAAA